MAIQHFYSQTVADGTATSVVRPSDWNSNHKMVYNLSGNTLGSSQLTGDDVVLVGGNNVTLSADTANSKLVFSAAAGGGGGAVTRNRKVGPFGGMSSITSAAATAMNGSLIFGFEQVVEPIQFSKVALLQGHSGQSTINASQVMSMTINLGIYSKVNDTQLTLMASGSQSFSGFWSSSTVTGYNGLRELYVPIQTTLDVGNYFIARQISVTGNNASAATANTISYFGVPMQSASGAAEGFGIATNVTQGAFYPFQGQYSTTTNAMPMSVGLSQVTQTGAGLLHGNFYREYVGS